jgi:serine/threonine protein kinase
MASDEAPARRCPSLDDILAHVHRRPSAPAPGPLLEHIDACVSCQALLAAALRHEASDEPSRRAAPGTLGRGDELIDRYRIERFVARGGMGEVYVAFDLLLEETVALKTLSCTSLDDERAAFRFKAEARLARRVTHPNVCRILEFGVHTIRTREGPLSIPFLTMEWLDGESVAQRIAANGPRPEDETFETALEVLEALGAIHAAGIVHRDLKSENVMLVPSAARRGRAVVMDFGLARALDGSVVSTWPAQRAVAGTLDAMAPEQLQGRAPTPAVDVFAFGVLLFEMLTGRRPFAGVPPGRRLVEPAPPVSALRPGLDRRWDGVVGRCLALDPAARFAGAGEAAAGVRSAWP